MAGPVDGPPAPQEAWRARMVDMRAKVAGHDPHAPVPWAVEPLVIPGTLAIVAGKGGAGKTWVMHEAADAVARGKVNAGLRGQKGRALILDGEMGEYLTVDRFAKVGYSTDIQVMDAQGLDLRDPAARELVWQALVAVQPTFVGIDSLKALTPTGKENESDDMGPVVNWIRVALNKLGAAGLLIHHAGWKEDRTRGSSAIKDRVDAVWYLSTPEEVGAPQRLSCTGGDLKAPRWCRPPADLWVSLRPEGGLTASDTPVAAESEDELEARLYELLADPPEGLTSHDKIAAALGRKKATPAIKRLIDTHAEKNGDGRYHLRSASRPPAI